MILETIRENLTPDQVLKLKREENAKGNRVNINRIHAQLVEIVITAANPAPLKVINSINHSQRMLN